MNLRQALATGVAVALVTSVAGVFAAPAAIADDVDPLPTYTLNLELPSKLGAGGGPAPFAVTVTRSAASDPTVLTLDFTGQSNLASTDLAISLGGEQLTVTGEKGRLQTQVDVPFGANELTKKLQFTAKLRVPDFGVGTESAAALLRKRATSRSQSETQTTTPTPTPEPGCEKVITEWEFDALKLDAALNYRPQELKARSAKTAAARMAAIAAKALATTSGSFAVGAPVVSLAAVPAKVESGGDSRPVKIGADNGTSSAYDKAIPYFFVYKQDLTEDDAGKVIVTQNGRRFDLGLSDFGFYAPLSKLSLPAGQAKDAQLRVGFAADVKPGKAFLVTVLVDKPQLTGARPLSANIDCKEIQVTPVDDSTATPTPSPTEPTPTPTATAAPQPAQGSPLAKTGANLMAGLLGLVLLLAGAGAVLVARRRKAAAGA